MLLNDTKGSSGMFSIAGKSSIEKYHILGKKEDIIVGLNKRKKIRGVFSPDVDLTKNGEGFIDVDDVNIFKMDSVRKKSRITVEEFDSNVEIKKIIKKDVQKPVKQKDEFQKYLELKRQALKKDDNPTCTKYNPKHQFIWKKTVNIGPLWSQTVKQNYSIKPKEEIETKFYLSHSDFKIEGKNFVELAKQTKRPSFTGSKNLRVIKIKDKETKTIPDFLQNEYGYDNYPTSSPVTSSNFFSIGTHSNFNSTKKSLKNDKMLSRSEEPKKVSDFSVTDSAKILNTSLSRIRNKKVIKINYNHKIAKAPDFNKTLSRDKLNKIVEDRKSVAPFTLPNFKWTKPRTLVMVRYKETPHKKFKDTRHIESDHLQNLNYDPNKVLDKINNHRKATSPKFDLMTSRPGGSDPLPSYMKRIYSRQSAEMLTEKTLKMNNFSDSKLSATSSSFLPKKSFNKFINLNLINIKKNSGKKLNDDYLQRLVKTNNKNNEELLKECELNKFDNITFKTIKKKHKIDQNDLSKFMLNNTDR